MANTILQKRSANPGSAPPVSAIATGELAVNTHDVKLFTKSVSGVVWNLGVKSVHGEHLSPASVTTTGSVQAGGQFIATGGEVISYNPDFFVYSLDAGLFMLSGSGASLQSAYGVSLVADIDVTVDAVYGAFYVITNGLTRMAVANDGKVTINGAEAAASLTVRGATSSSLGKSFVCENSIGNDILTVRDDAKVGINQQAPLYNLDVTGTARVTSSINTATLNCSNVNGSYVYAAELYVGGSQEGYLTVYNDNAETCFSVDQWNGIYSSLPLEFKPLGSGEHSPGDVGHVCFERLSNTQLRIRMLGSDYVIRSAVFNLS